MSAISVILDIVLILISIVLIVSVLMQQGQRQGLGAIAGGADTFLGKNKAKGVDAKLAKITKAGAVLFIVLAIVTTIVVSGNSRSTANANDVQSIVNEVADSVNDAAASAEATAEAAAAEATEAAAAEATEAVAAEATDAPAAEAVASEAPAAE